MISLRRSIQGGVQVCPRWPARQVRVDDQAWRKLQAIQARLPAGMALILTRGYEPRSSQLGTARKLFRSLGIGVFRLIYPNRQQEIPAIFGSNGHDIDGRHIDVSLRLAGRRVRMLPLGVFTPLCWQQSRVRKCANPLARVRTELSLEGFRIHHNATESLQIHCDLIAR